MSNTNILDSGDRTVFNTGAVRDMGKGKGRMDLVPLDVAGSVISEPTTGVLHCLEYYKLTQQSTYLLNALRAGIIELKFTSVFDAILEVSKHFESGASKYGENNWQKGIPVMSYIDSGARHYVKHLRGDVDEAHDAAFVWNLMCALWTIDHIDKNNP